MYGMRTIIPISIGLTRYDTKKKFAFINLISAWWAAITIVLFYFGNQIMVVFTGQKEHWYLAIPIAAIFGGGIIYIILTKQQKN